MKENKPMGTRQGTSQGTRHGARQARLEDYEGFVEKFKPKKTTDDCYTPKWVYDFVKQWVNDNIEPLDGHRIVRPFYPGGDYEKFEYLPGDIVLDNPPFSKLAEIRRFYNRCGVKYFLFGPQLTLFGAPLGDEMFVAAALRITYENGAKVRTGFITNINPRRIRIWIAGNMQRAFEKERQKHHTPQEKASWSYPVNLITSVHAGTLADRGVELKVGIEAAARVGRLDHQPKGKAIFGAGYLVSERLAAERLAAERLAAERLAAERLAAERLAAERLAAEQVNLSAAEVELIKRLK